MDFYNYKVKDIKKEIEKFGHGAYGKTIFLLAYAPALLLLIVSVVIQIFGTPDDIICEQANFLAFWILSVLIAFCLGSCFFYVELRKFMESEEKQKTTSKLKTKNTRKSTTKKSR